MAVTRDSTCVAVGRVELAPLDLLVERLARAPATIASAVSCWRDRRTTSMPGLGRHLGDARPHDPRADDAHTLDHGPRSYRPVTIRSKGGRYRHRRSCSEPLRSGGMADSSLFGRRERDVAGARLRAGPRPRRVPGPRPEARHARRRGRDVRLCRVDLRAVPIASSSRRRKGRRPLCSSTADSSSISSRRPHRGSSATVQRLVGTRRARHPGHPPRGWLSHERVRSPHVPGWPARMYVSRRGDPEACCARPEWRV